MQLTKCIFSIVSWCDVRCGSRKKRNKRLPLIVNVIVDIGRRWHEAQVGRVSKWRLIGNTLYTLVNSVNTGFGDAFMYLFIFAFAPSSVSFAIIIPWSFLFFYGCIAVSTNCESRFRLSGSFRFLAFTTGRMNKRWAIRAWRRRQRRRRYTRKAKEIKEIKKNLLHQLYVRIFSFFFCALPFRWM